MDDEALRNHGTWLRVVRNRAARALRFGAHVAEQRQEKRKQIYQDPRKRKLEPREYDTVSLTSPERLLEYMDSFRRVFKRRDTFEQARLYVTGLLTKLRRKNGETMEVTVPGITQESVYGFLARSPWSAPELDRLRVLDALRRAGCLGQPVDGIIDECGWRKKGNDSVGVARQYLGSLGKTDNGQVIVSLHLCAGDFDLPGPAELFMPEKGWGGTDEACRQRRAAAKVPANWVFRTKPELAVALLLRVREWGLHLHRVYGDAGYSALAMIVRLLSLGLEIVLGIRGNDTLRLAHEAWMPAVPPPPPTGRPGRPQLGQPSRPYLHTPDELRARVAAKDWRPVAYRQDVNGTPLIHDFFACRVHVVSATRLKRHDPALAADAASPELWLLLEQPCGSSGPYPKDELKQYVISGPGSMSLDDLADLAHRRALVERNSYENAKQETGLADYQGRSWPGLHHHLAMVWCALTYLMLSRRRLPPPPQAFSQPTPPAPPASQAPAESSSTDPAPQPPSPSAEIAPAIGALPPLPTTSTPAPCLLPGPAASPLAGAAPIPILIASLAPIPRPLRHQMWQSVQQVHANLCEWFAGMRTYEHIYPILTVQKLRECAQAGALPPLPVLSPLLGSGP